VQRRPLLYVSAGAKQETYDDVLNMARTTQVKDDVQS